jgi:type IV secretory pathway VirD2 relaxase
MAARGARAIQGVSDGSSVPSTREAEPIQRELGERGHIIKTMHRALAREYLAEDRHPSRYVLHRTKTTERIVGRLLDKGLSCACATNSVS